MGVTEPTGDQCNNNEKVFETDHHVGYAAWYPQMGGYGGKSVVVLDKEWTEDSNDVRSGGCFEAFVWHDGEFPFIGDEDRHPVRLHHCDPEQFIEFGNTVKRLNALGQRKS